mmetsp:Transcript_17294/g.47619  ORF Transcript_17294/g.47619 Transcript_17294/m.47619 type:complete len:539 (-) Transcript_17294:2273-3889(-)
MKIFLLLLFFAQFMEASKLRSWRSASTFVSGTPPSKRYMSGAAVTDDGRFIVFDGCGTAGRLADLYQLDLASLQWTSLAAAAEGTSPPAVCGPGTVYLNNTLITFGGVASTGPISDVFRFDFASLTWSSLETTGDKPDSRAFPMLASLAGSIYLYGGQGYDDLFVSGWYVYGLDLETLRWTAYPGGSNAPLRILGAFTADTENDRLLLHGGIIEYTAIGHPEAYRGELFQFKVSTGLWTQLNTTGDVPLPRFCSAMVFADNSAFLFGGVTTIGPSNSVHRLDVRTMIWSLVAPNDSPSAPPVPRILFGIASGQGKIYIHAGSGDPSASAFNINPTFTLGDLYEFDLRSLGWTSLTPSASGFSALTPSARVGSSLTTVNGSVFLFGGSDGGASGNGTKLYGDLFLLDHRLLTWSSPSTTGTFPSARTQHSAAAAGSRLFIYGGSGAGGALEDFFSLDTSVTPLLWFQIPRSFARVWPGPRAESRMAQAGGTLYLFGGFGTKGFSRLLLLLNCKSIACVISRPCINENPLLGSAGRFMVF